MKEKFIPGSDSEWGLELPDGDVNSLVSKDGKNWDNGYNFDERDSEEEIPEFDPEKARQAYGKDKKEA